MKLLCKDHPRDQQNVVLIHRWSIYAGSVTFKLYPWGPVKCGLYKQVIFIYRLSLEQVWLCTYMYSIVWVAGRVSEVLLWYVLVTCINWFGFRVARLSSYWWGRRRVSTLTVTSRHIVSVRVGTWPPRNLSGNYNWTSPSLTPLPPTPPLTPHPQHYELVLHT